MQPPTDACSCDSENSLWERSLTFFRRDFSHAHCFLFLLSVHILLWTTLPSADSLWISIQDYSVNITSYSQKLSQGNFCSWFSYGNPADITAGRTLMSLFSLPVMQAPPKNHCHKTGKYRRIPNLHNFIFLYESCLCHNTFNLMCMCLFTYE